MADHRAARVPRSDPVWSWSAAPPRVVRASATTARILSNRILSLAVRGIVLGDAPEVAYPFPTRLIIPAEKLIKSPRERGCTRMSLRRARCCGPEA